MSSRRKALLEITEEDTMPRNGQEQEPKAPRTRNPQDAELRALGTAMKLLADLDTPARRRLVEYLSARVGEDEARELAAAGAQAAK